MIENFKKWDSDFFQLKIGECIIESKGPEFCDSFDYDLIYYISSSEFEVNPVGYEHCLSEVQNIFEKEILPAQSYSSKIFHLHQLDKYDLSTLYELAFESGKYSRFKLDQRFTQKNFHDLYEKWIDNSINGDIADLFLIYKDDSGIRGLITCCIKNDRAIIGLLAVNKNMQGKGIGGKLVNYLQSCLFEKDIHKIIVKTQLQNYDAINFYMKNDFKLVSLKYIKHYWKI